MRDFEHCSLDWPRGVACYQAQPEVLQQLLKFYETLWELMQAQGSHPASDGTDVIKHSYRHTQTHTCFDVCNFTSIIYLAG